MNPAVQTAIAAAIAAVISSLVTAAIARRGQAGQERTQEWTQWREDNRALREQITELRDEVKSLEGKIDEAVGARRRLEAERDALDGRLYREQEIVGVFLAHLAAYLTQDVSGQTTVLTPDAATIEFLVRDLRRRGFSAVLPPQGTALQPPSPK